MDISQITDQLWVGASPKGQEAAEIQARNIRLIISMIGSSRPPASFAQPPLRLLWLQTYDTPLTPIPLSKLRLGVQTAAPVIQGGEGVLVYCARGRHRSVIMAAAILIARGYSARTAIERLRTQRRVADPQLWYIRQRIQTFERLWQTPTHQLAEFESSFSETYAEFITARLSQIIFPFRQPMEK